MILSTQTVVSDRLGRIHRLQKRPNSSEAEQGETTTDNVSDQPVSAPLGLLPA